MSLRKAKSRLLALALVCWGTLTALAQSGTTPVIRTYSFDDQGIINRMSPNGKWAAVDAANPANALMHTNPRRLNLATGEVTALCEGMDESTLISASASDVTDDGCIVAGELNGQPAIWWQRKPGWVTLPVEAGCGGGYVTAITPDGHYAVGVQTYADNVYREKAALWDLTTSQLVATPGLPTKDMAHEDKKQNRFVDISADGRTILGCMSVSYLPTSYDLGGTFHYIYHVDTGTYTVIGFDESDTERWTAHYPGTLYIDIAKMSNDGRYVSGIAYVVSESASGDFPSEENMPFVYDVQSGRITVHATTDDAGIGAWCVTNDGHLLGATPVGNPIREWSVKNGNYWIGFSLTLQDKYGYSFSEHTGYENTGTPLDVSDDGRTVAVLFDPYTSYVTTLPESVSTITNGINLLGDYSVSPAAGAALSKLQTVSITFNRQVEVLSGKNQSVQILDAAGNVVYTSVGVKADATGKVVTVTYRKGDLAEGAEYTLLVPAGVVCVKGDAERTNSEIRVNYRGRAAKPVTMQSVQPEAGATLSVLDMSSSNIRLTFDTQIRVAGSDTRAQLYRDDELETELYMAYADNQLAVFPASVTYLYKGAHYTVHIPEGAITDLAGNNGNEAITIDYYGAYEREVTADDKMLFREDFNESGLNNVMLYEGDRLTPTEEMQGFGFSDGQNYPWSIVLENNSSTDRIAASHSCYTTAGASDDWMVIPQLYIPDGKCHLDFQAQSYKKNKADRLKVIIYESKTAYEYLTKSTINLFKTDGKVVFDEQLSTGDTEEGLEGEWTDYSISLADYAGKDIYIAFVNDNEAQSLVMVDNISVVHEIPFLVTLDHNTMVVAQDGIEVKGRVTINNPDETFTTAHLELLDTEGNCVSVIDESGLSLVKGDTYSFAFPDRLPLVKGRANEFSVMVRMNESANTVKGTVRNLYFSPQRNVVLEEFTGMRCVNCPLGIAAIEKIRSIYGNRFIPISLHNYQDDVLGSGTTDYADALGLAAAPSGIIDRCGRITFPVYDDNGDYMFNGPAGEPKWLDQVNEQMGQPAEADITLTPKLSDDRTTIDIPVRVRFAMDSEHRQLNMLLVLLEDNVLGYQMNGYSSISDPDLGEWGLGGMYGKSSVYPYYHEDVARSWKGNSVNGTSCLTGSVTANVDYDMPMEMDMAGNVSDINNTKVVAMLIDAATGRVVNANVAKVQMPEAVHSATDARIALHHTADGIAVSTTETARVTVYSIDGRRIGSAEGSGDFTVPTHGHKGLTIVRVTTASGSVMTRKL